MATGVAVSTERVKNKGADSPPSVPFTLTELVRINWLDRLAPRTRSLLFSYEQPFFKNDSIGSC